MPNKTQDEPVCLSIYFPRGIYEMLKIRTDVTGRSLTKEVIHLLKIGLKYGVEADSRALSQLLQHLPKDIEQL